MQQKKGLETPFDLTGKRGIDKLFALVRAAQEETVRDYLERSDHLIKEDIDAAWKVLVPSGESSISRGDLTERLSYYVPHNDVSNTANLIGGGGSITYDKLARLLWNEATSEPALPCNVGKGSWALLDPHGRGSVTLDTVLRMLTTISGCDKLDQDDVKVVRSLLEMTPEGNLVREEVWSFGALGRLGAGWGF
ncbi:hypothetical protein PLESTB_001435100 [Pleodorina starrii]|uniref:Uncharacterized protein n=1 Tax=Pleodorina starrii TaxID=330485 RepID=A0A9W6BVL6_9CHLO|nr:hypothetical protein PLESTB_001435100 [Pleodorina starrii]